jgi:hypothetical protein
MMQRGKKGYLLLMAVSVIFYANVRAQHPVVTCRVAAPSTIFPGDTVKVKIIMNIEKDWHVYAPSKGSMPSGLQAVQVRFTNLPEKIIAQGNIHWPRATFSSGQEVFVGDGNEVIQSFIAGPAAAPGNYLITADIKYQACNKMICHPPATEKISIKMEVMQKDGQGVL